MVGKQITLARTTTSSLTLLSVVIEVDIHFSRIFKSPGTKGIRHIMNFMLYIYIVVRTNSVNDSTLLCTDFDI